MNKFIERKISRTDIFEVLFGEDDGAKQIAHDAFNECYRNHFGEVQPFEGNERDMLLELREFDVRIGVLTNRDREFFDQELQVVEDGSWVDLSTSLCVARTARDESRRLTRSTKPWKDWASTRALNPGMSAIVQRM